MDQLFQLASYCDGTQFGPIIRLRHLLCFEEFQLEKPADLNSIRELVDERCIQDMNNEDGLVVLVDFWLSEKDLDTALFKDFDKIGWICSDYSLNAFASRFPVSQNETAQKKKDSNNFASSRSGLLRLAAKTLKAAAPTGKANASTLQLSPGAIAVPATNFRYLVDPQACFELELEKNKNLEGTSGKNTPVLPAESFHAQIQCSMERSVISSKWLGLVGEMADADNTSLFLNDCEWPASGAFINTSNKMATLLTPATILNCNLSACLLLIYFDQVSNQQVDLQSYSNNLQRPIMSVQLEDGAVVDACLYLAGAKSVLATRAKQSPRENGMSREMLLSDILDQGKSTAQFVANRKKEGTYSQLIVTGLPNIQLST
ncbi:hypothetical protein Ciccas_002257 [Cichlidogyrus casuarinus]|uniref:Uncharacterized protein n=1 Tax=Cichlidogyrus casuarinus TaxID=1844966 RepID=A0ABD2QHR8_9PLAT